ncbi:MAG: hypothetical protein K5634_04000, partial [Sphaerochaetaceae bacterium]|nr:hypothetical protein [Sphaerochaetaceae bacterium]
MKRFSKIFVIALVLVAIVSCSTAKVETGDVKQVTVPAAEPVKEPVVEEPVVEEPVVEQPVVQEPAEEVEEVEVPDVYTVSAFGFDAVVVSYEDVTFVELPAGVTLDDFWNFAELVYLDFAPALKNVYVYPLENNVLALIGLDKKSAEFAAEVLVLKGETYVAESLGIVTDDATSICLNEDGSLRFEVEGNGQTVAFDFYKGVAYITYPEELTVQDLLALREMILAKYGDFLQGTTIELVEEGLLKLTYPEEVTYSDILAMIFVSDDDVQYLAQFIPEDSEVVAARVALEEAEKAAEEAAKLAAEKAAAEKAAAEKAAAEKAA